MDRSEFNEVVEHAIQRSKDVLIKKNDEYAGEYEVFANFKSGARGLSYHRLPEKYAWELLCKHLQSIKDIMDDIELLDQLPSRELIDEKFSDAHNYLYLIEGMILERK